MLYISIEEEMTEMISPVVPTKPSKSGSFGETKLTGYELVKDISNRFYTNKIHTNPEFYAKEKQRIKEYMKNRYNTDPEYAEKERQRNRQKYHANKLKRQELAKSAQSSESE
jgi:pyrroloquinoline quinone (PQQ) biosynthesis protein C